MNILFKRLSILSWLPAALLSTHAFAETADVVVHLHEKVSMQSLAQSVTDPSSPHYGIFYTPEEIRKLAGPSDPDYRRVIRELQAQGFTIQSESPTHLYITVRGEKSDLAKLQTRSFVTSVHGLNPGPKRKPHLKFLDQAAGKDDSGTSPAVIKKLYEFDAIYKEGITGKGQHIAIATYDGFNIQDVKDYYKLNALSPVPSVDQVAFNGTAVYDVGSAAETQTDAEFSGMIAPGASIHVFASAANSDAGELQLFTAILDDNRAKIVNYSWGSCESQLSPDHKTAMDAVFSRAAAQGINIMVASGDSGSDCVQDGSTVADYPAANPNVVAVGGTTLSDANGLASEVGWSGSGGGISTLYDKPTFQSALAAPYLKRSYPDVAFNADPASGQPTWVHYDPNNPTVAPAQAAYLVIGGTSIAAPQWSGFLALVGEARGAKALGSLNTALYAIPAASQNKYLNDVTSGNNGAYSCNAGWDAVTGLGSMHASELLAYLKAY
jgi:kumamolisin